MNWFSHSGLWMLKVVFAILVIISLSSCSSPQKEINPTLAGDDDGTIEESSFLDAPTREALYIYNNKPDQDLQEVNLKLNAEPLLLGSSYVRLVGVVSGPVRRSPQDEGGGKPMAVIEVSGRGFCVGIGDEVGEYKVAGISEQQGNNCGQAILKRR